MNIPFIRHAPIGNICQSDAFVLPNIVFFADGDYWHANPKRKKPLDAIQIAHVNRDKRVNQHLQEDSYIIQRFWESDLLHNREQCRALIQNLLNTKI